MDLTIILVNDNVIRSTLEELGRRTGATYWLVASPHYLARLSERHTAVFSRVIEQLDFSAAELIAALQPQIADLRPDRLLFLTNDESCDLICTELQKHFGGPAWPAAQVLPCVNKIASKLALSRAGVRIPRHILFDKQRFARERNDYCRLIADLVGFPMISKPIDRYASMDVRRIDTPQELFRWAAWCSSPKDRNTYEVDEFIEGELLNCDSLIQGGQVIWSNVCLNINPCMEFAEGRTIGVFTLPPDSPDARAVRAFNAQVLAALNPPDGATHMECFKTAAGELIFLEIGARPPGGDMVSVYEHCFGFDMDVAHFMLRARAPYRLELRPTQRYGAWAIHPRRRGQVRALHLPDLRSERRIRLSVAAGDAVASDSQHIVQEPAAEFWLYSDTYDAIEHDCRQLRDMQLCEMEA